MNTKSRFFWHDLMVNDVEKAKAFYGELFGWSFKTEKGAMPYTHIMRGEVGVGGMMSLKDMQGGEHIPPHWLGYINVDDVDAISKSVSASNGKVLSPKESVPDVGEWAVIADPTGAAVSPMVYRGKDSGRPESNEMAKAGEFCWDELWTSDPDQAWKFYTQVFGWGHEAMEMPGWGTYHLLTRPGVKDAKGKDKNAGGITKLQPGMPQSYWLAYICVDDADQTAARANKLGAKTLAPPMDIPEVGRFSVFMDSQQATFAILAPPKK